MRAGAFAVYPMYRGLAKLVGMDVAAGGGTPQSQLDNLKKRWDDFDFFFYHFKPADSAGEDGNFRAKVEALEQFDALVPQLRELGADVMMVAGDHSTPSQLASHSWHPVPFMIWSKDAVALRLTGEHLPCPVDELVDEVGGGLRLRDGSPHRRRRHALALRVGLRLALHEALAA